MTTTKLVACLFACLLFPTCALASSKSGVAAEALPDHRVFALNRQGAAAPLSLTQLIAELSEADVVILGEYHDDPATHRMQLEVLRLMAAAHQDNLVLTMEMFERDVQPVIDEYWQGRITEARFLEGSRPWKNYQTDYRPLIEFARSRGIPLIAANPPTELARKVAREGIDGFFAALTSQQAAWIALETTAPDDAYWQRFLAVMGGGDPTHGGMDEARIRQFYCAQCLKDDTMAESIVAAARWWRHPAIDKRQYQPAPRPVLHINGSFHSDFAHGVPQRVRQREPEFAVRTVALRPVVDFRLPSSGGSMNPHGETLSDGTPVADYVLFVPAPVK
jgi:uncharacterized iron-regulated protein